jgi:hypothetical protein
MLSTAEYGALVLAFNRSYKEAAFLPSPQSRKGSIVHLAVQVSEGLGLGTREFLSQVTQES